MTIEALKRLYLASLDMVGSDEDMPSHESTESEFVDAMGAAKAELAKAGIEVPKLD